MKDYDKATEAIDTALKIVDDINLNDFTKKGKLYARKAKIYVA